VSDIQHPADISTFKLRRRTPGSFLMVPCPRQGRSIRCQGQLEATAAVTLVSCPLVETIQEQPLAIWYLWREREGHVEIRLLNGPPESRSRRSDEFRYAHIVPDFLVVMTDGRIRLVEVKPSDRLIKPKVLRKLAVAQQYADQNGWTFHVVTEKELLDGPLISNLRLLNRYRLACLDEELLDQIEASVTSDGIEFASILSPGNPEDLRVTLFHLLAVGRLSCDPRIRPLSDKTIIYPGGVILWDPFDSLWARSGCSTGGHGGSSANSPPTGSSPKTSNFM
jgi:hypothetical protein